MGYRIKSIQALSIVTFVFMLRPGFLGQAYSVFGLLGLVSVTAGAFFVRKKVVGDCQEVIVLSLCIFLFWLYCLGISVFIGDSDFDILIKACLAGGVSAVVFGINLSDKEINSLFFKYFAFANSFLGWSIAFSSFFLLFVSADFIRVGTVDIKGYSETMVYSASQLEEYAAGNGEILFPFSPVYGVLTEYGIYRFLGLYRESGIAQLFFVFSGLYYLFDKDKKHYLFLGCFLGAVLCSSTTVIFSMVTAIVFYVSGNVKLGVAKQAIFIFSVIGLIILAFFAPGLGILDKLETHTASFDDRILAMSFAWQDFPGVLIGNGLYPRFYVYENIGINAISYVYHFGLFGLFGYFFLFLILPFFWYMKKNLLGVRYYLTALAPLLITSIFFQPLIDAPLAYVLLFYLPDEIGTRGASA